MAEITFTCEQVLEAFAQRAGLRRETVLEGARFECEEQGFWLYRYDEDPHALTIMMDTGEIPEHSPDDAVRRMLVHNASTPVMNYGYYAIVPGSRQIVYCLRFVWARGQDAQSSAKALETGISLMAVSTLAAHASFADSLEQATGMPIEEFLRELEREH